MRGRASLSGTLKPHLVKVYECFHTSAPLSCIVYVMFTAQRIRCVLPHILQAAS
jgi:hypothetical protein